MDTSSVHFSFVLQIHDAPISYMSTFSFFTGLRRQGQRPLGLILTLTLRGYNPWDSNILVLLVLIDTSVESVNSSFQLQIQVGLPVGFKHSFTISSNRYLHRERPLSFEV